jgi:hypothetical protein
LTRLNISNGEHHEKSDFAYLDQRHPFSLISGIVVSIIGLMLGWDTSTQFSDDFFGPVPSSSQSVL